MSARITRNATLFLALVIFMPAASFAWLAFALAWIDRDAQAARAAAIFSVMGGVPVSVLLVIALVAHLVHRRGLSAP